MTQSNFFFCNVVVLGLYFTYHHASISLKIAINLFKFSISKDDSGWMDRTFPSWCSIQHATESPWRLWNLCWGQNFGVYCHNTEFQIAQQVQADPEKRAHDLDLKYPGSTFTQVLKSHGKDGRYLVLVVGPSANLSDYFMVLCDFLGRARALEAINSWNISPKHALGMNRHILRSHFGHLASLVWAKLILGRFRDAVLPDFSRFPAHSDD